MKILWIACLVLLSFKAHAQSIEIETQPIPAFKPGSPQTSFGKLTFLGGLHLTSANEDFGGLSALRFLDDGTLIALTDKARVLSAKLYRRDGRPSELADASITRIKSANGRTITGTNDKDSEALEVSGNSFFVGYERNDRVMRFSMRDRTLIADPNYSIDFLSEAFPENKGPEAIALDPVSEKLFVITELALDDDGNHKGYVVSGGKIEKRFAVKRRDGFSITDAAFLINGDLILLERYFNPFTGVFMRMRRIEASSITDPVLLDGEVLIDVDYSHEIDNMEGLAVTPINENITRLTIMSDDNFSSRQRTLLLEFSLEN